MSPAGASKTQNNHEFRAGTYLFFFLSFLTIVYFAHWPYLALPYFWDELGQFVPAGLDILRGNHWIPRSTQPNVHPPGVMAYLAAVWGLLGYSIEATRCAMLVLTAVGVLFTFLLALRLPESRPGIAGVLAVLLLLCDPLFFTQSMMAQLDMPAMVFCLIALVLFVGERHAAAAAASTAAVLAKETSILLPAIFVFFLVREGRRKAAAVYALPFAALAFWLAALWAATGTPFGNRGFEHYNITYSLHPVRVAVALVRRIYYVFIDNFRWVGTVVIALAWRRYRIFASRAWRITMLFAAAHIVLVSLLGGAELERYLMPALPIFYISVGAALTTVPKLVRNVAIFAMCGGLITGLYMNPVFPFPFEDNLAMVDFVQLQQRAALYLESNYKDHAIYTAWPLTAALRRPEFGYVQERLNSQETSDLRYSTLSKLDAAKVQVLVMYSRTWEPRWSVLSMQAIKDFLARFYEYEPQMTAEQCRQILGLARKSRWEQRGQWIEVYARP